MQDPERKIIILIGDNEINKQKHLNNLKKEFGEYRFAKYLDIKPMQDWVIVDESFQIIKIYENTSHSMVILSRFLFSIPIHIKVIADIYYYFNSHSTFNINFNSNTKLQKDQKLLLTYLYQFAPLDLMK
jgi:hypothetical protein